MKQGPRENSPSFNVSTRITSHYDESLLKTYVFRPSGPNQGKACRS